MTCASRAGRGSRFRDPSGSGAGARGDCRTGAAAGEGYARASDGAGGGPEGRGLRVLFVDDDPSLRALLRATFAAVDVELEEAGSAQAAEERIAVRAPDVVVLGSALPDVDGIAFCRRLKADPATGGIRVVILTGASTRPEQARAAGADASLRKPFSPLELLRLLEGPSAGLPEGPAPQSGGQPPGAQLLLYARDLRWLLELAQGQRVLLQRADGQIVGALAAALDSRDAGTGSHSRRVGRYAVELTRVIAPDLLEDPSLEYGFLLHDLGKIAIPDRVLLQAAPLSRRERRLMQTHTVLGEQMLAGVEFLHGQGLSVVRSHHERWDGRGYPDGLAGSAIPLAARIFALADALDAITSDRPYRRARSWEAAAGELAAAAGGQFDPQVVAAFRECESTLRRIRRDLAANGHRPGSHPNVEADSSCS